jgi:hypothetical protein
MAEIRNLTAEARVAINAALKAMSIWRDELVKTNEKNGNQVLQKMAAAAAALGWPEEILDAARTPMQTIADTQIKMIDQIMDVWNEQLKLPDPMTASPSAMLSRLKSLPGLGPTGSWPSADALQEVALTPLQIWVQFAAQWQRLWAQAMTAWGDSKMPAARR